MQLLISLLSISLVELPPASIILLLSQIIIIQLGGLADRLYVRLSTHIAVSSLWHKFQATVRKTNKLHNDKLFKRLNLRLKTSRDGENWFILLQIVIILNLQTAYTA